ncbi:hypothetical protein ABVF61_31425 [Roseibium sp. HPY-6]|uniref:hypothetical protein n=1 Tax=Roseibium sp. HPY-6 TaxID=3229852 RepID=UPI00338DC14F
MIRTYWGKAVSEQAMAAVNCRRDDEQPAQLELPFFAPHTPASKVGQPENSKSNRITFPQTYQLPLFDFKELRKAHHLSKLRRSKKPSEGLGTEHEIQVCPFHAGLGREVCFDELDNRPIRFVPRNLHGYLDRHFPSFVVKRLELFDLSIALADEGKTRVGDVVQMRHAEIEELLNGCSKRMESLLTLLNEVGLDLDMKTPGWKSPGGLFHSRW